MEDAAGPAVASLACWRLRPRTIVVEAEDMESDGAWKEDRRFKQRMTPDDVEAYLSRWKNAIGRV